MTNNKINDITIIGAGPAGLYGWYCAEMIGLKGFIIEQNKTIGGQPEQLYPDRYIYDLPIVDKITGKDFINKLYNQASKKSKTITLKLNTKITSLSINKNYFVLKLSHQTIYTKTILITIGDGASIPIKLKLDNNYNNISYYKINYNQFNNKRLIILGGGDSAVDLANEILENNITKNVTLIHRGWKLRSRTSDLVKLSQNKNLKILLDTTITKLNIKDNSVTSLIVNNNNQLQKLLCDHIIVQYGCIASYCEIEKWPLNFNKSGKILISSSSLTNIQNIYAAGSIAHYPNKFYNLMTTFSEVVNAIANINKYIQQDNYSSLYFGYYQQKP